MKEETLKHLRKDFGLHPVTVGEPVPEEEITALEQDAGFPLPDDYKEFVREFGGGIVGPFSIYGLRAADAMGDDEASAMDVTNQFRADGWEEVENWLVFSSDHAGNPIGIDRNGKIWINNHDTGSIENIADNFEDYLRINCLSLKQ